MPLRSPYPTPVYLTADIRRIEALAAAMPGPPPLMERAGLAAAKIAAGIAGDGGQPVLVIAGPGNNGGDAFVIARHLRQWWYDVALVHHGDEARLSGDAAQAVRAWREAGGKIHRAIPEATRWALVVDGLFGIGLQREVAGEHAALVDRMNACRAPILAVDVPSGIDSDTGRVLGHAVRAAHTVTFIALKPGLLTLDGPDHCGEIHVATLDIDAAALQPATGSVVTSEILQTAFPARALNSHKGTYGSVGILGGASGMAGAALLAGRAALKLGAGRVYVGMLADTAPAVDLVQPELMLRAARDVASLPQTTCIAVGPGLGQSEEAAALVSAALAFSGPVVADADALNLVAAEAQLQKAVHDRAAPMLMTPHPAEAARLLGCGTGEVQRDRIAAACSIARSYAAHVVLKGAGSVIASPDGTWAVNPSGNPGMASAGMGDVLTGFIAALLARGTDAKLALRAAVYLHGAAADALVTQGTGPVGLAAGELVDAARTLINRERP